MVLEFAYGAFGGIALVYVWGYYMVSDIPVFLNDALVLGGELIKHES